MSLNTTYWDAVRRRGRLTRKYRIRNAERWLPTITELCRRSDIEMKAVEHGWQFIRDEYVINWSPSTNKVSIQYRLPGHARTIPFTNAGKPNKPRVIVALEEVMEIVRVEERPRKRV